MQVLRGSPMIGNLAMLVVSYGVSYCPLGFWVSRMIQSRQQDVFTSEHFPATQTLSMGHAGAARVPHDRQPGHAGGLLRGQLLLGFWV